MMLKVILIYLLLINVIAFIMYGADKSKAKKHAWRTPEATLIGVAVIGGSIGALAGMFFFHHKTKHIKFRLGLPVIFIAQIVAVIACGRYINL